MSAGIPSAPGAFPGVVCLKAFATSTLVGGSAIDSWTGNCGRDATASSEMVDSLYRTLLKCSTQRTSMSLPFQSAGSTDQTILPGLSQSPWVHKRREGHYEVSSCHGSQLLLVAPLPSCPTSRSSSSADFAGEVALPVGSPVSSCCCSCQQCNLCGSCAGCG